MVQLDQKSNKRSDKKNDEIRSLIKDQSPIRTLKAVLDQQGAGILIQV
jgi:hypothetical protein